MDLMKEQQTKYEASRAQANRDELTERIAQVIRHDGTIEPLKGLHFNRSSFRSEPCHSVSVPAFCVIAQGSKEVLLGNDRYQYDPMHYLLATVELPIVSQILEASKEQPYLSLRLDLDPILAGSVMVEAGYPSPQSRANVKAIDVSPLNAPLLDAVVRLIRLLEAPAEARVLMPLITREIIYRLLMGEQGSRLRHIAVLGGYTHHMARAIDWTLDKKIGFASIMTLLANSKSFCMKEDISIDLVAFDSVLKIALKFAQAFLAAL